jgi:DNA-binding transcriptional LysR family regulator
MWQWDNVRVFLAIARQRSLSGAARVLRVDHATIGRRLTAFEEELGAKLFDRTPAGFAITVAGQTILNQCEVMESAAASVDRLVAGYDTRLSGLVRVATTEVLAQMLIVPALAALQQRHPELQVQVIADPRTLDLGRRQADLAVRMERPTDANLLARKLGDFGFAQYASHDYVAVHGVSEHAGDLTGHTSVSYAGAPTWFRDSLTGARAVLLSNSPFVQMTAVADGIGIGKLACCLGDRDSALRRLRPNEPPEIQAVWLIMHRDLRRVTRIRLVSNAIVEAFGRNKRVLRDGLGTIPRKLSARIADSK